MVHKRLNRERTDGEFTSLERSGLYNLTILKMCFVRIFLIIAIVPHRYSDVHKGGDDEDSSDWKLLLIYLHRVSLFHQGLVASDARPSTRDFADYVHFIFHDVWNDGLLKLFARSARTSSSRYG